MFIVCDTDFLSSFLKIDSLDLVKRLFKEENLHIPRAVLLELAKTNLIIKLLELDWIKTEEAKEDLLNIFEDEEIKVLGEGEKECILLCKEKENSILLINDRKAREIAKRKGISTLNTSAFLLLCKIRRIIDKDEIICIMESLKEKDYFEFSEEEKRILLE